MHERTLQTIAGEAAFVVALSSIIFGLIFLFVITDAQKGPAPNALISYAANPIPIQIAFLLVILGSLSAFVAIVGIYRHLFEKYPGWALLSLLLGVAFSLLTALDATYTAFLLPFLSTLYATGDTALKASAVLAWNIPSPINPYDFSEFFLSGLWLLVTGWLIMRSGYFARILGYLALAGGIGQVILFVSTFTGTVPLIVGIGVPGAVLVGPLFWLWTGYTLWTKVEGR
jgi:hypothetical protein